MKYEEYCMSEFEKANGISTMQMSDWHDVPWTNFFANQRPTNPIPSTGINKEDILLICQRISELPSNITAHSMVRIHFYCQYSVECELF
jgi:2-oxoglutarate dehydrogenase E1 component